MTASRSQPTSGDALDQPQVLELARLTAEPAVTILMPIAQPTAAHPETEANLRALVERALNITGSWWGPEVARRVARLLESPEFRVERGAEEARGLAILATPDDASVLRLPFAVEEQVVVNRTFATRQLFEGLARHPRHRVLVLDGHRAKLFEGQGHRLVEVTAHGFPLQVEPPHEGDTPQRDFPLHDESEKEEHRAVYRTVDAALGAASAAEPLPVVVAAAERELVFFEQVTDHADLVAGLLRGNHAHDDPARLAAAAQPVLDAHRATVQAQIVERLHEAQGRARAVAGLDAVRVAADEGRGHLLVVEEGFMFPQHWVDGLTPGSAPNEQLEIDDVVDDVIEAVLLGGGSVEFVDDGALIDLGRIGLFVRY